MISVTMVYDNTSTEETKLRSDWGFSCLVEAYGKKILFDTGAKPDLLLENLEKLRISLYSIDEVFISHSHWDHTGGLQELYKKHPCTVFVPPSFTFLGGITLSDQLSKVAENIYSTGEMEQIEQSLLVKTSHGIIIIVGCAHSGIDKILERASILGDPYALIGGFHDFEDISLLENLRWICPTHCTKMIEAIRSRYPRQFLAGGVGQKLIFEA